MNRWRILQIFGVLITFFFFFIECQSPPATPTAVDVQPEKIPFQTLSEYGFFKNKLAALQPSDRVLPYDLITPLFSDYAYKARFVWMPDSVRANVRADGVVDFPENTVLIKNFYYPKDFRRANEDWQILETRLLVKLKNTWQTYTYAWDEAQTEATLTQIGDFKPVSWTDESGIQHDIEYVIPNKNQCKSCHYFNNTVQPIGPKVQNLNRTLVYADGEQNQLEKWQQTGILQSADFTKFHSLAKWDNAKSADLQARALAYLDVNCGHCHRAEGGAHTSGLYLLANQQDNGKLGFCKTPVAAGKGSGGRKYGIVPGQPDASILLYRMESDDPGEMMPELGRVVEHREGIALIRAWIESLEGGCE
jgi:uncharacterized repeat protein (TIGR03806 family)